MDFLSPNRGVSSFLVFTIALGCVLMLRVRYRPTLLVEAPDSRFNCNIKKHSGRLLFLGLFDLETSSAPPRSCSPRYCDLMFSYNLKEGKSPEVALINTLGTWWCILSRMTKHLPA